MPPQDAEIRRELRSASDPDSLCEALRSRCERFGQVRSIDLLPLAGGTCGIVCIVDMETRQGAGAAVAGLELAPLCDRSLVCVVDGARFSLTFPYRPLACRSAPSDGLGYTQTSSIKPPSITVKPMDRDASVPAGTSPPGAATRRGISGSDRP